MLWERRPRDPHNRVSPLNFLDWSEQNQAFASIAAIAGGSRTLTGSGGDAERIPGQAVTSQFFDVLGIRPIAGRTFVADDARAAPRRGGPQRAAVAHALRRATRRSSAGRSRSTAQPLHSRSASSRPDSRSCSAATCGRCSCRSAAPSSAAMHYMQVIGRLQAGRDPRAGHGGHGRRRRSDRRGRARDEQGLGRHRRAAA